MNTGLASATELAAWLSEDDARPLPRAIGSVAAHELSWALKDHCYAAWSSDPQRAVRAASALDRLRAALVAELPADAGREMNALAHWTSGVACMIQGEMEAALAAFEAAQQGFESIGHRRHAAQVWVPRIVALGMLGRHDEAADCAARAHRALLEEGDRPAAAKVLLNLGNLHLRADRFPAAVDCLREAAGLFQALGMHEHAVMADNGLGDALTAFGRFDEAVHSYARAGGTARAHGLQVLEAVNQESVALLDLVRGRYAEALAGLEHARRRYADLDLPQHLAIAEKQLADAYLELRLLPEALAGYDRALHRFEQLDMQVDRAWALLQRGRALADLGHGDDADAALAAAAAAFASLDSPVGQAGVGLAQAQRALADGDLPRARALAAKAAGSYSGAELVDGRLRARSVEAQALLRLGQIDAARELFESCLCAAQEHQLRPVAMRSRTGRAMALLAQGDLEQARSDFELAAAQFESQWLTLPSDEIRSAFLSDHLLAFEQLLALQLRAHERGECGAESVLLQLERFRARGLADRLGGRSAPGHGDGGGDEGTQQLRGRLAWLYRRLRRGHDGSAPGAALVQEIREIERVLLERLRRARLVRSSARSAAPWDDGAGSGAAADSPGPDDLQALLDPADAFIEYGLMGDELFAVVMRHQGLQVHRRIASWREVLRSARALRFQIESLHHADGRLRRHREELLVRVQTHLQRLHRQVWAPLSQGLCDVGRVMVVPQGPLGAVPFAALHDGDACLGARIRFCSSPSARVALHALRCSPRPARQVLALGESSQLPHAAQEAEQVHRAFGHGMVSTGAGASIDTLRRHAAQADVIHLACHAQFRPDNPVFSALHLSDGALTAEAIESLQLDRPLVVLSACDTALHGQGAGEEMVGLARAFLLAGASRVLASLWPMEDAQARHLMAEFYAGLRLGLGPSAALQQAQAQARQVDAHPAYWAALSLVGAW